MSVEIEHEYTDEVVCPYCGKKSQDSYEYFNDSGGDCGAEIDCDECGETFFAEQEVSVSYSTQKKIGDIKP